MIRKIFCSSVEVGDGITSGNANWTFAGDTAKHFDEHINKSVPLYKQAHELALEFSDFFVKQDTLVYDLGCSTGTFTKQIYERHLNKDNVKVIGIDNIQEMIERAIVLKEQKYEGLSYKLNDIATYHYETANLFTSFYTIQFIDPQFRQIIFDKIYSSLVWGGAFIMFEKVRAQDARFQDMMTQIYNEFKLSNGYSPSEIIAKSKSLKGILEPFSTQANFDFLSRAGFSDMMTIFKYGPFEGFIAIK